MVFNSVEFLVFFPIVVILYFIIPQKYKWVLLLVASYYFYMAWKPEYILLILFSTIINYYIAIFMEKCNTKNEKKKYLYISLFANLGILFLFKYFNFFSESINAILSFTNLNISVPMVSLLLPMGISFYTFQTLSYTIDVYNEKTKAERHFGIFALYVTFFPQLVAGPIERSEKLLPQFYEEHNFKYDDVTYGLKRMAWGFFKKVIIADRIGIMVNTVYNNPQNYKGLPLIIATLAFGIQIYCDFSGYSDIAIGSARVMGFRLMENFKRPYFSKSISEFWRRWHISLSTWFKDYIYIPLGGNRVKVSRAYLNLFITFLVSGLWHGASWNFIIWGALHGTYLVFGKILSPIRKKVVEFTKIYKIPKVHNIIKMIIVISLVMFAWIFFRANTIYDAMYIVSNLFVNAKNIFNPSEIIRVIFNLGMRPAEVMITIAVVIVLISTSYLQTKINIITTVSQRPLIIRYGIYYALVMCLIIFAYVGSSEFIYFQF